MQSDVRLGPVIEGDCREFAGVQDYVYTAPPSLLYVANTVQAQTVGY